MVHIGSEKDKYRCTKCRSIHVDIYEDNGKNVQACLACGYETIITGSIKNECSV